MAQEQELVIMYFSSKQDNERWLIDISRKKRNNASMPCKQHPLPEFMLTLLQGSGTLCFLFPK